MSSVEQAQAMAIEAIDKSDEGDRYVGGLTLLSACLLMWTSFQKVVAHLCSVQHEQHFVACVSIVACLGLCCFATFHSHLGQNACTTC